MSDRFYPVSVLPNAPRFPYCAKLIQCLASDDVVFFVSVFTPHRQSPPFHCIADVRFQPPSPLLQATQHTTPLPKYPLESMSFGSLLHACATRADKSPTPGSNRFRVHGAGSKTLPTTARQRSHTLWSLVFRVKRKKPGAASDRNQMPLPAA